MSTARARARTRVRCGGLLAALALAVLPLGACSDDAPPPTYSGAGYDDVAARMQHTLAQRAAGLRRHDVARFRRSLDRSDATLIEEQQVYFDNIEQLPVGKLRYVLDAKTIAPVAGTGDYRAEVTLVLRLDGYDAVPARTRARFRFTPSADKQRLVIASTTDRRWASDHPGNAQPWDLGPVRIKQAVGVLGVFDDQTVGQAGAVLDAAANGRYDVRSVVGADDSPTSSGVVVYAVRDPAFLRGLAGQTVGDPDRADGLTLAVPADAHDPARGVASYRVYLNPRVLGQPTAVLGRLVRHELTHATLGDRARGIPLWLNEGIAEYVSVQSMAPDRRRLPAAALRVAEGARDLPGSAQFAGPDAEAWYAVSWWTCEYIARVYGEQTLFRLADRLRDGADQGEAIESLLGTTSTQLVQRGVALMATTYRG